MFPREPLPDWERESVMQILEANLLLAREGDKVALLWVDGVMFDIMCAMVGAHASVYRERLKGTQMKLMEVW